MQNIESSSSSAPPVLEQAKARVGFRYNDHDLEVIVNPTGNVSDLKSAFRSAASISRIPLDPEKELLLIYHGHPFNSQDTYDTTTFDKQPIFVALVLSKTISTASHDPEQKPWYSRWFEATKSRWRSILATVGAVSVVGTIGALLSKWGRNVPPTSAQQSVTHPSLVTGKLLPAK
jgi:hypothetical protein